MIDARRTSRARRDAQYAPTTQWWSSHGGNSHATQRTRLWMYVQTDWPPRATFSLGERRHEQSNDAPISYLLIASRRYRRIISAVWQLQPKVEQTAQQRVSYEFICIRKTCDYIWLNVQYCMLLSSRVRGIGLGLGSGLYLVSGW